MPPRAVRSGPASPPARKAPPRSPDWVGYGVGLAALAALLWACRGAPLGVPAADDYDYLHALRFGHPLDLLGPMGSLWYWRPLSRQLYFAVFDRVFFDAPWVVAAIHALLLAAFFVFAYRAARRAFDPLGAAAIASFPLLAEPTRALFSWPTGAQPLLAMTLIALALHEAVAKRAGSAALALLAALLCHEQALLAVPVVPLVFAARARDRGKSARMVGITIAVTAIYAIVRTLAIGHGAGLPARGTIADAVRAAPSMLGKSLAAQFDLATLTLSPLRGIEVLEAALVLAFLLFCLRRPVRARLRARAPALLAGLAWFALGILPLAFASALWTPRHTSLPALGLGLFVGGALACAAPELALGWTLVRLVALLLAPTAPMAVPMTLSAQTTPLSFLHVARLQRTADSARRALMESHPTLPRGSTVRYWSLPRETQIAFAGSKAVQVWYRDSTLTWGFWDRYEPGQDRSRDPILGFNLNVPDPAVVMRPAAVVRYQDAVNAWTAGDLAPAEQSFFDAIAEQQPPVGNFTVETARLLARIAYTRGQYERADSLNRVELAMSGRTATYFGMVGLLAMAAGDSARALEASERCLALRPGDEEGTAVRNALLGTGP
jgi:hypothetical protein